MEEKFMKRILSLILALIIALSLGACKKSNSSSSDFVKHDGYVAVLNIKINPEFNLYIDSSNNVLALEAVNGDASSFSNEIESNGKSAQSVVQEIVQKSNEKGFLLNEGEISVSISETIDSTFNFQDLLISIETTINTVASSLNIKIEINISSELDNNDNAQNEDSNSSTTDNNNAPTSSTAGKNEQVDNNNEKHSHKFSSATCTTPEKCDCGATNGNALGHSWTPATCTTPKTCSVCKATEGSKGSHTYKNEVCTVCGASNILNPKQNLKMGYEYEYVAKKYFVYSDEDIYAPGFQFCNDGGFGDGDYYCIKIEAMFTSVPDDDIKNRTPVNYNNKNYYRCGAGQSPAYLELTDSEIIITNGSMKIKAVLLADGTIKIVESTENEYPVGMMLSTEWTMLK